ncbi:hypothetical protein BJ322DRAFT_845521 [Thelephora terrestris]|uniref:DUF6533 domain-containing protein n=1 Tax=Thelephora terrestris TaxID=56493 RepID=A0A9P6L6G6_9AGAM|nr:hypothetical protein BJ322DRAFT_845521 [Thelephora terrestris]
MISSTESGAPCDDIGAFRVEPYPMSPLHLVPFQIHSFQNTCPKVLRYGSLVLSCRSSPTARPDPHPHQVMSTYLEASSFLRIASISVAGYDYLFTLPVEIRVYTSIKRLKFGWTPSVVMFILLRYVSIILLVISNFGWFYHGFSADACSKYHLVAPVFKVIQIIISQAIIGYRTWNISQRSRDMGVFLLAFGLIIAALEGFSNLGSRSPVQNGGNCSPGNNMARMPQWVFYLLSTIFDVTTIGISSFFLIKSSSGISRMSSVPAMLFYDGLGYVFTLIAVNTMNLILYRNSIDRGTQASGASFGFMVVWVMSQSFLIHIHEAAEIRAQQGFIFGRSGNVIARNAVDNSPGRNDDANLGVQVQIEQAIMVDYNPKTDRKATIFWERKRSEVTDGDSPERGQWELSSII